MLKTFFEAGVVEAGCDEAGRGCLAGPVFAAAVVLPEGFSHPLLNDSKQMTARNRETLREVIEREAAAWAVASVSAERIDRINILNASFEAMTEAVKRLIAEEAEAGLPGAAEKQGTKPGGATEESNSMDGEDGFSLIRRGRYLPCEMPLPPVATVGARSMKPYHPEMLLIDGNRFRTTLDIPYRCIVGGDGLYASIAAASVLAKTHRDRYMERLAADFPQYGWLKNKGYPTREHREAIARHGLSPHHRKTFRSGAEQQTLF